MYARVVSGAGDPDRLAKVIRDTLLPGLEGIAGFQGVMNLSDRQTGEGFAISFWESEEALRRSEEEAGNLRRQAAQATDTAIASVKVYEVIVATGVAEPTEAGTSRR